MKALIVYDSKTGNTEKMAVMIAEGIRELDGVECAVKRVEDATLRASKSYLKRLYDNDQLVFRYCYENGEYTNGVHLINPNGAFYDIAGICDPTGTIFGLMPHPERAYYYWQLPDWTKKKKCQTIVMGN